MLKMSIFSLANFLILMAIQGAYQTLQDKCPPGWLAWRDACYILLPDQMNWWQAKKVCDRPGSSLVVPGSQEEHEFIQEEFLSANGTKLWIGCEDAYNNGSLSCFGVNGDHDYTNWKFGDPSHLDQNCIRMDGKFNGQWRDSWCNYLYYAACEMRVSCRSYTRQADHDADGRLTPQCLLNHEIHNLTASGVIECGQECWAEPRCRSFNLWQEGDGKKVCQLNSATKFEAVAADIKHVENCSFYEL